MPKFSQTSLGRLSSCDERLRRVAFEVVKTFDCSVLCGYRSQEEQDAAVVAKRSKLAWPNSKHNSFPSQAIDLAPYPIDWEDQERFYYFAGWVMCTANRLGIHLRWGGDWDSDTQVSDQNFMDLVHFELI